MAKENSMIKVIHKGSWLYSYLKIGDQINLEILGLDVYTRVGRVSYAKVFGIVVYRRIGNARSILGIRFAR